MQLSYALFRLRATNLYLADLTHSLAFKGSSVCYLKEEPHTAHSWPSAFLSLYLCLQEFNSFHNTEPIIPKSIYYPWLSCPYMPKNMVSLAWWTLFTKISLVYPTLANAYSTPSAHLVNMKRRDISSSQRCQTKVSCCPTNHSSIPISLFRSSYPQLLLFHWKHHDSSVSVLAMCN